jgi:hypothetical protein
MLPRLRRRAILASLLSVAGLLAAASAPDVAQAAPHDDPLPAMVRRIDRYLRRNEVDGVTMDWRYSVSPSEEIRQTVVCQVLAYVELYRLHPTSPLRKEVVEHADFMLGRLNDIRSHTPFDGMLAYSLFAAWETTGEARFLVAAREVGDEMLAIPTWECVLNGGLMVAMGTALDAQLTGNAEAAQKTRDILEQLVPYQNEDGSFPHWCGGSRDIHYTGWMAMELIHLERMTHDPTIAPMLERMTTFLEARIAPDGRAIYEEPCPQYPGCMQYFDSRRSGCDYDYDTRGWTVEPAYCALLFHHQRSPKYEPVIGFLDSLEEGGTLPDLYGYWPPPEDPEYPWTIADTSVVNMSIIFWVLATDLTEHARHNGPLALDFGEEAREPVELVPAPSLRFAVAPNPARGRCAFRYASTGGEPVSLVLYDASGRIVRRIQSLARSAGDQVLEWDCRDAEGRDVPSGPYFARLRAGNTEATARVTVIGGSPARR